jgi:hypothetical protein
MGGVKNAELEGRSRDHRFAPDSVDRAMEHARSRSPPAPERSVLPPVAQWVFQKTSQEGKTMAISYGGKPIEFTVEAVSPFDLSSFGVDSIRKSLTLRLPPHWGERFECLEACLLDAVHREAPRFLGSDFTFDQVAEAYKPVSKRTGDYPRNLRVKVNTRGLQATRYWDAAKNPVEAPEHHAGLIFSARVTLRSLWFVNDTWGLVAECTDLKVLEAEAAECPF